MTLWDWLWAAMQPTERRAPTLPFDDDDRPAPQPAPLRRRVCSSACRYSTHPAARCRCVCGGQNHGTGLRLAEVRSEQEV